MLDGRITTANGFTLIELIVVVALLGILTAAAAPSFQGMVRDNRAAARTNEFVTAVNLARSAAVKRGQTAMICQSDDADVGSPSCDGNGGSWHDGWLVFVDENGDNTPSSDEVVRVWEGFDAIVTLDGNGAAELTYEASGTRDGTNTVEFDLAPEDCNGRKLRRHIRIPPGGRPSVDSHLSC